MQVVMGFSTPIGIFQLDENLCTETAKSVKDINNSDEDGVYRYYTYSITSPDNLHTRKEFVPLVSSIQPHVDNFVETVLGISKDDFRMTCMWANSHSSGSKQHIHPHPNSFLSGVVYLQCPPAKEIGKLSFNDPRPAKNMFYPDFIKESCISNHTLLVEPKLGMLLLFPSWLEHGTDEFVSDTDEHRIGISFNYVLTKTSTKTMRS